LLVVAIISNSIKYVVHSIEIEMETQWDEKSLYFFYIEIIMDFLKLICYFLFFGIVCHYYGIPIHIIRDVYITLRAFIQKCRDLINYRAATQNMNQRYPDATEAELANSDRVCIICREEMSTETAQLNDKPKKLPCGHIFHLKCLKNWLERQQTCPTCRQSVFQPTFETIPPIQPVPINAPNPPAPNFLNQPLENPLPFILPPDVQQPPLIFNPTQIPPLPATSFTLTPLGTVESLFPNGTLLFNLAPLEELNDQELRELEGTSREAAIKRIRALEKIQRQLTGVITQLSQVIQQYPLE
jgi:E3 ubiquitin-protein ligase synoviolin